MSITTPQFGSLVLEQKEKKPNEKRTDRWTAEVIADGLGDFRFSVRTADRKKLLPGLPSGQLQGRRIVFTLENHPLADEFKKWSHPDNVGQLVSDSQVATIIGFIKNYAFSSLKDLLNKGERLMQEEASKKGWSLEIKPYRSKDEKEGSVKPLEWASMKQAIGSSLINTLQQISRNLTVDEKTVV